MVQPLWQSSTLPVLKGRRRLEAEASLAKQKQKRLSLSLFPAFYPLTWRKSYRPVSPQCSCVLAQPTVGRPALSKKEQREGERGRGKTRKALLFFIDRPTFPLSPFPPLSDPYRHRQ